MRIKLLLTAFIFILSQSTFAQKLQTILDAYKDSLGFYGINVCVSTGDKMEQAAVGFSSPGQPMQQNQVFGIGSVTKVFLSVTVLKMQEQKLLSLDDHIGKYIVPQNRFIDTSITIRQLMNHSSGIKDFTTPLFLNIYMFQPRLVLSEREVLNAIDTVDFPKGTKHSYSNSNYFILGLIVEKIMDKPLSEVFQQMVITPCQLSHTYPHLAKDIPMLAHPMQGGQDLSTRFSFLTICDQSRGAGQMASTTADLCDLFRALFIKKTLLSQSSLDQMLTFYQGDENELYGLGMFKRTYNGKELYYHTGRIVSYGCYVYCNPETNTVMALLTNNMNDTYSSRIRYKVFDAYLK